MPCLERGGAREAKTARVPAFSASPDRFVQAFCSPPRRVRPRFASTVRSVAEPETCISALDPGNQVRLAAGRVLEAARLRRRLAELEQQLDESGECTFFDAESAVFRRFLASASQAAASDATVLLRGESGTGKNVLARWIRAHGPRADAPLAYVNCTELHGDLMASALFGHRKGAFTGAITDVTGKVQEAEHGTLFLDEVGELSSDAQARLLRLLHDGNYERLGEAQERRADVRILAATRRPLNEFVQSGRFREDLSCRLHAVTLTLPPLRERREDLLPFARHFLARFGEKRGRRGQELSPEAEQALLEHPWPGNLRELRNAVERAVIVSPASRLGPADLGLAHASGGHDHDPLSSLVSLSAVEREHIARVIAQSNSLESAARTLGIDATTLEHKRKRYSLM